MYNDCANFVKTCDECQRLTRILYKQPLHPTWSTTVWETVGVDVVDSRTLEGTCVSFLLTTICGRMPGSGGVNRWVGGSWFPYVTSKTHADNNINNGTEFAANESVIQRFIVPFFHLTIQSSYKNSIQTSFRIQYK